MTPEDKKALFEKEPDKFVHREDIIAGMIRIDKGFAMCIFPKSRDEMTRALGELQVALMKEIIKHDTMAAMQKNNIIKPGAIMGFARTLRRR